MPEKFIITISAAEPDSGFETITALATKLDMSLHPEHPIVLPPEPSPPLVIWGPTDPRPTPPIVIPPQLPGEPGEPPLVIWGGANEPFPTPPIFLPPQPVPPLEIWGGANEPFPTPPIYLPVQPPEGPGEPPVIDWDPCRPRPVHPIYIPPQIPGRAGTPPIILTPAMFATFKALAAKKES